MSFRGLCPPNPWTPLGDFHPQIPYTTYLQILATRPIFTSAQSTPPVDTARQHWYGLVALNMLIVSAEAGGEKAKCRCAIKRQRMDCGGAKDSNQYLGSDDSSLSNSDRRSDSNLFASSNRIYRFRFGKNRG